MTSEKLRFKNKYPGIIISAAPSANYNIYLITMDKTSQFFSTVNQGVSDMSKLTGFNYIWNAPQKRETNEQIAIINDAVSNGANAIMLAAIDPVKESRTIEDAKALGVKIIYVDSPANEAGIITLATDNYNAGISAGKNMLHSLEQANIQEGFIGIISVTPETFTTLSREQGFRDVIEPDGRFQLLKTKYIGDNLVLARWATENFIANTPNLVGVFGTNEASTSGVGYGIEQSGKKIAGIGFDWNKAIEYYINHGYLQAVMVQNPYTMGYLGMAETIAALKGYPTGPAFLNTGVTERNKTTSFTDFNNSLKPI